MYNNKRQSELKKFRKYKYKFYLILINIYIIKWIHSYLVDKHNFCRITNENTIL